MKFNTLAGRALALGAVSAVTLGGLATVAPAANAAPVTTTYTCGNAVTGPFDAKVETDLPELAGLVTSGTPINAGADVPADFLSVTNKVTISAQTHGLFAFVGATEVSIPDFAVSLGETKVSATGIKATAASFTQAADTTYSAQLDGKNAAFEIPAVGTYNATPPAEFTLRATKADGGNVDVPCKAAVAPSTAISSVDVTANEATVTAKAKNKKVAAGTDVRLKVKVAADNETPTGKVKLTVKGKKVGKGVLENGKVKVVVKAKKLKVGKNKIVVSYAGDDYTEAGKAKVKIKVIA